MTVGWCETSFCCVSEYNRCRWGPASLPGQHKERLRVPWWSEAHARHTAAGQWVQQPLPPNAILGSAERKIVDRKNHREGSLWTGCQGYGWKSARNARKGDRGREDVERWVLRIIRSTVITGLRYSRTIAWQIRLFLLRKRTSLGQERFAFRTGNNESTSGSSARDQAVGLCHYGRWELTSCNYNITHATSKPYNQNIFDLFWNVRILLFGLSRELSLRSSTSCLTQTFPVSRMHPDQHMSSSCGAL